MDGERYNSIRNLWNEEINQIRRFVGSKFLAYTFMIAYIIMIIALLVMIFVTVINFITRHTHGDDMPEENVDHHMKGLDSSDISGFLYLVFMIAVIGCLLFCRPCSLCGIISPHNSEYQEI